MGELKERFLSVYNNAVHRDGSDMLLRWLEDVKQVGDPYCYTDSGIVVKLAYSNTDTSLQDRLRAYACSLS